MYGTVVSLIPFMIVIPIALWTKQVILGLGAGLVCGSYILHPSLLGGLTSLLHYIAAEAASSGNLNLLLFLFLFGSFVGLIRVSGGVAGFSQWMERRIHSARGAFSLTWVSSVATFMAPDFRIITIAPVVRNIFSRLGVAPERVAFAIDVTSTPLCAVVPLGTAFVGYMVGLMHTASDHAGQVNAPAAASPYRLFLAAIPFNFFAWAMLIVGFVLTFARHAKAATAASGQAKPTVIRHAREIEHQPFRLARHIRAAAAMETGTIGVAPLPPGARREWSRSADGNEQQAPDVIEWLSNQSKPRALHLVLPIALLLALTMGLTYWSGYQNGGRTVFQALTQANASAAMLQAVIVTVLFMFVFYSIRRIPISRTMAGFLHGGNEMMSVNVLLVLIWGVSAVSADLGFSQFCQREIAQYVPHSLIVPALFVFGCAISYVIGSSFGTWAMLMPLAFSLAGTGTANLAVMAGAVFASGTFGGFASPLSDNTIAMSTVMKLPVMKYAAYKTKSAILTAGACAVLYWVAVACFRL
ncbi:Na+/H+ antiporter NhaC family protein [Alicyclobacillus acidiphilus]|uniref:Na+/H+ antiporter NhaC family protein n=1 Tax=Alicyclobacillus acidiphilus TaxID=182455 RepID=UPI00082B0249|nr:Na+/H+ antiporter NhaC family protein [Alicyclobacillus acidiphilus]